MFTATAERTTRPPEQRVRLDWFGDERQTVVSIDNFAPDPLALKALARDLEFGPVEGQNYPGVRALAPTAYFDQVQAAILAATAKYYELKTEPKILKAYYSLAMTPLQSLSLVQRLPHYDTIFEFSYPSVLYLCEPEFGGTAFFRHRATGFETLNPNRIEEYEKTLARQMAESGEPAHEYILGDTDLFDHIGTIEPAFNRLAIFRGNTLHSGAVPNDHPLPNDPMTGRLTIVNFVVA